LPTVEEQREIVRIIENYFNKESLIEEALENVINQIDLMKKSILSKAFRGELGTNNQEEENSIELLRSIIEEA
jgi:type I restriction enzyme S subunit